MQDYHIEPGSFRDRTSRVFYRNGAVMRGLDAKANKEWEMLCNTDFFKRFMAEKKIIQTERVEDVASGGDPQAAEWKSVLRHQTIPFISYPYEWSFGMLKDTSTLQLELLLAALDEDMILKDSSAFNFQWIGAMPVFIDIPSFEELNSGEPWVGYRQFCQMFLYPLFLQAYKEIPFHPWLRGNIDGIEPEHCDRFMSVRDLLRPGVLSHVYLQAKMQAKYGSTQRDVKETLRAVNFNKELIKHNIKRLDKIIRKLKWKRTQSEWADYAESNSYSDSDRDLKTAFVRDVLKNRHWNLVWDLGCNTGVYSRIAADYADYVVAMDADSLAIERLYQTLKKEDNERILPLINNVADPSPRLGWRGLERKDLADRGCPDVALCLALIHHIVISANIPLKEFIDWLAALKTDLIIEFVNKEDPMVKTLLRNKEDNYADYEIDYFEKCLSESFKIMRRDELASGTRILFFAQHTD